MVKTFVLGDAHGRIDALKEVMSLCKFDYTQDRLIVLGDVCDGDVGVRECFDLLLKIKNLVFILGNHDLWFLEWIENQEQPLNQAWWQQGGMYTAASYEYKTRNVPKEHIALLKNAPYYYEQDGCLFVHGGFNPNKPIEGQDPQILMWDRDIINYAMEKPIPGYKKVFIGHTTTQIIVGGRTPITYKNMDIVDATILLTFNNLTMLDTGAGWSGKLSVMDINTMEYWQSKLQKPGPSKNLLKRLYFKRHNKPLSKKVTR